MANQRQRLGGRSDNGSLSCDPGRGMPLTAAVEQWLNIYAQSRILVNIAQSYNSRIDQTKTHFEFESAETATKRQWMATSRARRLGGEAKRTPSRSDPHLRRFPHGTHEFSRFEI